MTVKAKICGITNLEDAKAAVDSGADMLGFVFYKKSPRFIAPEKALKIIDKLPDAVEKVAVFVDEAETNVKDIISRVAGGVDILQFHGSETADYCRKFDKKIIKVARIKDKNSIDGFESYKVDFFLLDSFKEGAFGGTGKNFDWKLANDFKKLYNVPVILSGGLTCSNVKEAIEKVRPYAIDVSSGVEAYPGKKDARLVKEFIKKVKEVPR
ncbi:MAG: phosphoribosylanthranilate isomerase [Candidatus Omnitrophica bacterium]|nr:phosphoribosylanthranilate isomerase [Candidatus Omnitrophota bacterium]